MRTEFVIDLLHETSTNVWKLFLMKNVEMGSNCFDCKIPSEKFFIERIKTNILSFDSKIWGSKIGIEM